MSIGVALGSVLWFILPCSAGPAVLWAISEAISEDTCVEQGTELLQRQASRRLSGLVGSGRRAKKETALIGSPALAAPLPEALPCGTRSQAPHWELPSAPETRLTAQELMAAMQGLSAEVAKMSTTDPAQMSTAELETESMKLPVGTATEGIDMVSTAGLDMRLQLLAARPLVQPAALPDPEHLNRESVGGGLPEALAMLPYTHKANHHLSGNSAGVGPLEAPAQRRLQLLAARPLEQPVTPTEPQNVAAMEGTQSTSVEPEPPAVDKQLEPPAAGPLEQPEPGPPVQPTARPQPQRKEQPAARPQHLDDVASVAGIQSNSAGDMKALVSALILHTSIVSGCMLAFSALRKTFPQLYTHNTLDPELAPKIPVPNKRFCGWIGDSLNLSVNNIRHQCTLDAAMLIEFMYMAMKLMVLVGIPCSLVLIPLHLVFGMDEEEDKKMGVGLGTLSRMTLNNVPDNSWIFHIQAALAVYVVFIAEKLVSDTMEKFMQYRKEWLRDLPKPRNCTILVEGIRKEYQTDGALKDLLEEIVGEGEVEQAYVIRDTTVLLSLIAERERHEHEFHLVDFEWKRRGRNELDRPTHTDTSQGLGEEVDSIDHHRRMQERLDHKIQKERNRVRREAAAGKPHVLSSAAFVTFQHRKTVDMVGSHSLSPDEAEFCISEPPAPEDVVYTDFLRDRRVVATFEIVGYACIAALFLFFIPLIGTLAQATQLSNICSLFPAVKQFLQHHRWCIALWQGVMQSFALNLIMSALPMVLRIILHNFFTLKSESYLQERLARYYFYFQLVIVLLINAVGHDLLNAIKIIASNPPQLVFMLSSTLPEVCNFYLSYQCTMWSTHAWCMLRPGPLIKYLLYRVRMDPERARQLAEPEDQDYDGIGCRCCRLSVQLLTGLTFCNITPIITVLTFVNFWLCRLFYGYLFVFAETRKTDMGGQYWVQQLLHVQEGIMLYIFVMAGMLLDRTDSRAPGIVVLLCLIYQVLSYSRFLERFHWKSVPHTELKAMSAGEPRQAKRKTYAQPELEDSEPEEEDELFRQRGPRQRGPRAESRFRAACC